MEYAWQECAKPYGDCGFSSILQNAKGNYIYCGSRSFYSSTSNPITRPYLLELKPNGDTVRSKTLHIYSSNRHEGTMYWSKLVEVSDGGYLFSVIADSILNNKTYSMVSQVDTQFNLKWNFMNTGVTKDYGILRTCELLDKSFVLLGVNKNGNGGFGIINISPTGQYLAHKFFQSSICTLSGPQVNEWKILPDGTIIIAGRCVNFGYSYVARVIGFGPPAKPINVLPVFDGKPEVVNTLLPNEEISIETIVPEMPATPADLYVYDLTGRIVKKMVVKETDIAKINIYLEGNRLSNGVYICKLIPAEGEVTIKRKLLLR